jgi:hypothetical protein
LAGVLLALELVLLLV